MPAPRPAPAPNILFLLSDQQRWDTVGCYGRPILEGLTPHLDRLAADGVRFHNAFTMQPVCGPARSCLQSGLFATQTGCFRNDIALPLDQPTLAKALAAAGYATAYVGKWHLAAQGKEHNYRTTAIPVERRGGYRDYWVASDTLEFTSHGYEGYFHDIDNRRVDWEGYRVDATTRFVRDYLRQYATGHDRRPFFCLVSYIEPHHQNDLNRYIGPIGSKERFKNYRPPGDLVGADCPGADWRQQLPDYLGCCWSLDQNVGVLREELRTLGLADNTLVIYTSDHGCHFRTRNREYKRSCHDASLRVPLLAAGPGFQGGKVIEDLVSLIDLPPTVLRATGASLPKVQGRPLQDLLAGAGGGGSAGWPQEVFAQISENHTGRCVRTRKWKYAIWAPPEQRPAGPEQPASDRYVEQCLYDLEADPHELNNRVADPALAEVRADLRARLVRWMKQAGEKEPQIVPA